MKTSGYIVSLLLPFFMACSKPDKETASATNWVVLNPAGTHAATWSPDESTVPGILNGAKSHLELKQAHPASALEADNIRDILSKWDGYSCQVFPVIRKDDATKRITMSFFPSRYAADQFKQWRKEPVMVKGGGSDFWTLSYDPEKNDYSDFGVNASR